MIDINEYLNKDNIKKLNNIQKLSIKKAFQKLNNDDILLKEYSLISINNNIFTLKCNFCNKTFTIRSGKISNSSCGNKKCSVRRSKATRLKKYGNENYCNTDKIKQTKLKHYGDEKYNNIEKNKQTCIKKYGVSNANKTKKTRDKIKQTKLKRYGDEKYNNIEKNKQTCIKKYGVDNVRKSTIIKEKIHNINMKKWGNENWGNTEKRVKTRKNNYYDKQILNFNISIPLFTKEEYLGHNKEHKWKCSKCDNIFIDNMKNHIPLCPKCYIISPNGKSKYEYEISDWLNYLNINNISNKRFYENNKYKYEIDIFLPDFNIGIEFDGIYWHSELKGKDKNYHVNKTDYFNNKHNINIIHIFEDEWKLKKNIIKSIIKNKLNISDNKINSNKCIIKEIDTEVTKKFIQKNNIHVYDNSNINLGLFHNNKLISIMTFKKNTNNWLLDIYSVKINHYINNGFNKMILYFKEKYNNSIITYLDRKYFNNYIYPNFNIKSITKPNCYYFKHGSELIHSNYYTITKLKSILETYNEKLNIWDNMQINGYNRIWDCGRTVLIHN
jgi:Zn finger protein HypA/HybF involved in hydrogenase expression